MRKTGLIIFAILFSVNTAIAAEGGGVKEKYVKAAANLKAGKYAEAEKLLAQVYGEIPGHPDVNALLGVARYHLGKYADSLANLEFAIENKTKYAPRVLYYLGLCCSKLGRPDEAGKYFSRLLDEFPGSLEASRVGSTAAAAKPVDPRKDRLKQDGVFDALFIQDAGYDTNARLSSTGESSWTTFSFFTGRYRLRPLPLNIKGTAMRQEFASAEDLELLGMSFGLEGVFETSARGRFLPALMTHTLWLGGEKYETKLRFEMLWEEKWSKEWISDVRVRAGQKDYIDEDYENLAGSQADLRLRMACKKKILGPLSRIRLGLRYVVEDAEKDSLAYDSARPEIEIQFDLPGEFILDADIGLEFRAYDARDQDYGLVRHDRRWKLSFSLLRKLYKTTYFRSELTRTSSDSNTDDYTFTQTTFSIGVLVIF